MGFERYRQPPTWKLKWGENFLKINAQFTFLIHSELKKEKGLREYQFLVFLNINAFYIDLPS